MRWMELKVRISDEEDYICYDCDYNRSHLQNPLSVTGLAIVARYLNQMLRPESFKLRKASQGALKRLGFFSDRVVVAVVCSLPPFWFAVLKARGIHDVRGSLFDLKLYRA